MKPKYQSHKSKASAHPTFPRGTLVNLLMKVRGVGFEPSKQWRCHPHSPIFLFGESCRGEVFFNQNGDVSQPIPFIPK